jgi:putative membrane protein
MNRAAAGLLTVGVMLFFAVLASQGLPTVLATLGMAGWGLVLVALFHVVPLVLDAAALRALFDGRAKVGSLRDALLARWVGESANSLMPAGQIGGPVLMSRHLAQRGIPTGEAVAAVTVSTTLQAVGQILFALLGVVLLGLRATHFSRSALGSSVMVASGLLALQVAGFYYLQKRGLFGRLMRTAGRFAGKRDWTHWQTQAESIDRAVAQSYARGGAVTASFLLSLIAWLVGTGEVCLILDFLHRPVGLSDAMMIESLGQGIRGAGFFIPGALGVQEGGYLLLAPLAGLPPDIALAVSLAKRAREILLGLPGLIYIHWSERGWRRRVASAAVRE